MNAEATRKRKTTYSPADWIAYHAAKVKFMVILAWVEGEESYPFTVLVLDHYQDRTCYNVPARFAPDGILYDWPAHWRWRLIPHEFLVPWEPPP